MPHRIETSRVSALDGVRGLALVERNAVIRAPVGVSEWSRGRAYVTDPLKALVIGDPGSGHSPSERLPSDVRHDVVSLPHLPAGTRIRGVRLRPEAVAEAFGVPATSLRNLTLAAEDVFGQRDADSQQSSHLSVAAKWR